MKTTNDENDSEDFTEAATGEYPVIKEGEAPPEGQLNGKHQSVQTPGEKAAFWLSHLETEVTRLHAKWHSIDAEFKVRETRIAELREEVKARDEAVKRMTAELRAGADALKAANERLARKDVEIEQLANGAKERDEKIADLTASLGEADVRHRALEGTLRETQGEVTRLGAAVRHEQEAAAGVAKLNEELLADQRRLQGKLQDLEIYINGRHESWSELNAQLADYKDALIDMERTVRARDAAVARFDEEKRQLAARILDLERQCSELAGRRKEREAAYDDLQSKLAAHIEATEQLKAEHAARTKETEQALAKAMDSEKLVESLERGIAQRDENLAALGAELEQQKTAVGELTQAKDKLGTRVEELEQTLHEQTRQAQALRDELEASRERASALEGELAERTNHLAASRSAVEEKSRLVEQLTQDLRGLEKDAADVRNDLVRLEEHSAELGRLRSEALTDVDRLKAELAAQQELVASLETELRAKQAAADLLERNVGRITDLGASLAALDRQMDGGGASSADLRFPDFVETVAPEADEAGDLISVDALIGEDGGHADVVDVGEPLGAPAKYRKLVAMLGDAGVDYPLTKREMTIGRGHGSDIRLSSHFISRIHAKISTNGIATVIEDAGSKNGILVNSERVRRRVLRDGDIVSLGGELNLRFVDAAP